MIIVITKITRKNICEHFERLRRDESSSRESAWWRQSEEQERMRIIPKITRKRKLCLILKVKEDGCECCSWGR